MPATAKICVVDDDQAVLKMLTIVFSAAGYEAVCFADGASFLSYAKTHTPICILLDVHMPGRSGLDILKELNADNYPTPIFIMSGQGDISMAVEAIKNGALDFIEKPFRKSEIISKVREAIGASARREELELGIAPVKLYLPGREPFTRREREVLAPLMAGASNKDVAHLLGISVRTVEFHRSRLLEKAGVRKVAELVRIIMRDRT